MEVVVIVLLVVAALLSLGAAVGISARINLLGGAFFCYLLAVLLPMLG